MNIKKISCNRCSTDILESTYKTNNGLCDWCKKGAWVCSNCNTRITSPLKDSNFDDVCIDCKTQIKRDELNIDWKSLSDIDWGKVKNTLIELSRETVQKFLENNNNETAHCIIIDAGQCFYTCVHIGIIEEFDKNDPYYFEDWKYNYYKVLGENHAIDSNISNVLETMRCNLDINDIESYELLFNKYYKTVEESVNEFSKDNIINSINKTNDFKILFFIDGYECDGSNYN